MKLNRNLSHTSLKFQQLVLDVAVVLAAAQIRHWNVTSSMLRISFFLKHRILKKQKEHSGKHLGLMTRVVRAMINFSSH